MDFDADTLMRLRAELPAVLATAYLNSGTAGPIPRVAAAAEAEEAERELAEGRGNFATFGRYMARAERVRASVARLLGGDKEEIALTHHTSEGLNIVLWGLRWQPGDRIVTTTLEHPAVTVPLSLLRERFGVQVDYVAVGAGERALPELRHALTRPARLCVVSHVIYSTGARLPLGELAGAAHAAGGLLLVDGAQGAGIVPTDVRASGVDFYTVSGQKWLCGPEGTGALFVRRERIASLSPTFASYFSMRTADAHGNVVLHDDARRFEVAMMHRPSLAALEACLTFLQDEVGVERAFARARALADEARRRLSRIPGVSIVTPSTCPSQLLSFALEGWSLAGHREAALELSRRGVVIRSIEHPPCLRAAFGYFNHERDLELLTRAVSELATRSPA